LTPSSQPGNRLIEALAPAETRSLADNVAERLRRAILNGDFEPGERLREEQLAGALRVSRGPIREAFAQLEREGLVQRRRHRGVIVSRLSERDLAEVYSLRVTLEALALRWAARNATPADCERMERAVEAIGTSLSPEVTVREAAQIDLDFHDLVYEAAHHERLHRIWLDLRPQVFLFFLSRDYVATPEFRELMVRTHSEVVDVIRARDAERAEEVAGLHMRTSYLHVLESYRAEADDWPATGIVDGDPEAEAESSHPAGR
jgi:DNA-binding GntR family transcriptional regulator